MLKKTVIPSFFKMMVLLIGFFLLHSQSYGQNQPIEIKWDGEVGCRKYLNESQKDFLESIEDTNECARVCSGSTTNYTITGSNIVSATWNVVNGNVTFTNNGLNASIQWSNQGADNAALITVTVVKNDNTTEIFKLCAVIVASPNPLFDFNDGNHTVCRGSNVDFLNLSNNFYNTETVSNSWDFGDGHYSNEFSPSHTYTEPGNYNVILTVTNECNCSTSYSLKLTVLDKASVVINCPSVVCQNEVATYTVENECGGNWKVIGGTIISENENSIEILWNLPDFNNPNGLVSYKSTCGCDAWTTVKVPIIANGSFIQGDKRICIGEQGRFTLSQWPSTDYVWKLDGDPNHPDLILTDQRNEVVVKKETEGGYQLSCIYKNTLTGCTGETTTTVNFVPEYNFYGPEILCEGEEGIFNSLGPYGHGKWTVIFNNETIYQDPAYPEGGSSVFEFTFESPGGYLIRHWGLSGCTIEKTVTVLPRPSAFSVSTVINGVNEGCKNISYDFSAINDDPANTVLVWETSNGVIEGSNVGNQVIINFATNGSHTVSVYKRLKNAPYCKSDPITKTVKVDDLNISIKNIEDESIFCASTSTNTFRADINFSEVDYLDWSFENAIQDEAFIGSVIGNQNTRTPVIGFNQLTNGSATTTGFLVLKVRKCGVEKITKYPITIINNIDVNIIEAPLEICALTEFQIKVGTSIPLNSPSFKINYNDGGSEIVNIPPGPLLTEFTLDLTEGFKNVSTNIGASFTVQLMNSQCESYSLGTHNLTVLPTPKVMIINPNNNVITACLPFTKRLKAHLQMDLSQTVLQWFKFIDDENDQPLTSVPGTNNQEVDVNQYGKYYVKATSPNGCTSRDYIEIKDGCSDNTSPPACNLNESVSITNIEWLDCNRIKVTATATSNNNSVPVFEWQFNSSVFINEGIQSVSSYTKTITLRFRDVIGIYSVGIFAKYTIDNQECIKEAAKEIRRYYSPDIRYEAICNANGTYNLKVWNNSTYFTDNVVTNPPTVSLNVQSFGNSSGPALILNGIAAGNYTATLTLSSSGLPTCTKTININLPSLPNQNAPILFQIDGVNMSEICSYEAIKLVPPISNSNFIYTWSFGNPEITNNQMSPIVNLPEGTVNVKLNIKTRFGCELNFNKNITVKKYKGTGSINQATLVCATNSKELKYLHGNGANPVSYQWMRFNTPIDGATGPTYQATQSGSYWVIASDAYCANYRTTTAVNVTIPNLPYAYINGPSAQCKGNTFTLNGITDLQTNQQRWFRNDNLVADWTTSSNWDRTFTENTAGTYVYRLEVRNAATGNCVVSYSHTVVINNTPTAPTLSYQVLSCSPYRVRLTATGGSGHYIWSNGMTGTSIEVTEGGPYMVTLREGGCEVSSQFIVPKSPEGYLWIFPTGCYNYCGSKVDLEKTILGPSPFAEFSNYRWIKNGNTIGSGTGSVTSLNEQLMGDYELMLDNGFCQATKGIFSSNYNGECQRCDIPINFPNWPYANMLNDLPNVWYFWNIQITNPYNEGINVTFQSPYGFFIPNNIYVPANSTSETVSVRLISTAPNWLSQVEVNLQVSNSERGIFCKQTQTWLGQEPYWRPSNSEQESNSSLDNKLEMVQLQVVPNPAESTSSIRFDVPSSKDKLKQVTIYNMLGVQMWQSSSMEMTEEFDVDVSRFSSGNYIVVLQVDGKITKQQKLIKK